MVHAIRIHETGGPDVLRYEEIDIGTPGPGEVLVRHTAIGVNYIDVYYRTGLYSVPGLPFVPGLEGAGVIEAVGETVVDFKVGDRVAYVSHPIGAYAEARVIPADRLVPLPKWIDEVRAAGMMMRGITSQYLLRSTYRVQPGDTVLVHAAAGGVGLILCQWAKELGATVIGTVGSDEKAEIARAHGCDHVVVYTRESVVNKVKVVTDGVGVPVVYDAVGRSTFMDSLDCLRPRGMMVLYGQASGPVGAFDPAILAAKGSLFLTRPTIFTYTAKREDLMASAAELFEVVRSEAVKIEIGQNFALKDAKEAHRALEARSTTGSTILLP